MFYSKIIKQFENKTSNDISEKSKSEIIKFYIKRNSNINLLSYDEIQILNQNLMKMNLQM